jgi:hypothetical protein
MLDRVELPVDYEEVAEFTAVVQQVDVERLPRHLREQAKALSRDCVVVSREGPGITAALRPEARALLANLRIFLATR